MARVNVRASMEQSGANKLNANPHAPKITKLTTMPEIRNNKSRTTLTRLGEYYKLRDYKGIEYDESLPVLGPYELDAGAVYHG